MLLDQSSPPGISASVAAFSVVTNGQSVETDSGSSAGQPVKHLLRNDRAVLVKRLDRHYIHPPVINGLEALRGSVKSADQDLA